MTQDSTEAFHHQCSGKHDYGSLEGAQAAAISIKRDRNEKLGAYQCHECHGFHIGHGQDSQWKKLSDGTRVKKQHLGNGRKTSGASKKRNLSRTKQRRVRRRG